MTDFGKTVDADIIEEQNIVAWRNTAATENDINNDKFGEPMTWAKLFKSLSTADIRNSFVENQDTEDWESNGGI